jgi:hypothetical protein
MVDDKRPVLCRWTARRVQPVVLLWVAAVFVGYMLIALFVFHSTTGVRELAIAAVAALVPLVPAVLARVEYRLDEVGLEQRPVSGRKPTEFTAVFRLAELSHVKPIRFGFKFYRPLDETSRWRRFWKLHVSDAFSGEVHVDPADRDRVVGALAGQGVIVE